MPITLKTNALKLNGGSLYFNADILTADSYIALDEVSPEMYGAIGDGINDDTLAWQKAVDSGKNVVSLSKTYRCSTINVTRDISIDCNNAEFVCTSNTLFNCNGTIASGTSESNYSAFGDYTLSDTFTGIAYIVGTNNVFPTANYYVGGSLEHFYNGVMDTQIPIDITSVTAYRLNPISVNIRNIKNVSFSTTTNAVIVKQTYCAYSIVENVNMTNVCYSVVQFNQCFKCVYKDSHFDIPLYGTSGTNYYPIEILNSCYTLVSNVFGHCVGWHCASTGGTILCRKTRFENCEFYSDHDSGCFADHSDGIETEFDHCVLSPLLLGYLGKITNCDIVCGKEMSECLILVRTCDNKNLATYSLSDCTFYPQTASYSGIIVRTSTGEAGYNLDWYLNKLSVTRCRIITNIDLPIYKVESELITGAINYDTITIIDSDFTNTIIADHVYQFPA